MSLCLCLCLWVWVWVWVWVRGWVGGWLAGWVGAGVIKPHPAPWGRHRARIAGRCNPTGEASSLDLLYSLILLHSLDMHATEQRPRLDLARPNRREMFLKAGAVGKPKARLQTLLDPSLCFPHATHVALKRSPEDANQSCLHVGSWYCHRHCHYIGPRVLLHVQRAFEFGVLSKRSSPSFTATWQGQSQNIHRPSARQSMRSMRKSCKEDRI